MVRSGDVVSIGTIAQKALRRLGVRVVPLDDSPTLTEMVPFRHHRHGEASCRVGRHRLGRNADPVRSGGDHARTKSPRVHAALDAQGVVWWPVGSVPRAFTEEYTKLVALFAATSFGKPSSPQEVALLEGRVRKGVMVLSADDNAQQAVQAVHDDLVMRGIARWTSLDIPDVVGEQYAIMAADRLAPLFDEGPDPNGTPAAMAALYRYVALPSSGETVATAYF